MSKHGIQQKLADEILSVISSRPLLGFRRAGIRRYLGNVDEAYFKEVFKALLDNGKIVKARGGRYRSAEELSLRRGTIHVNAKGFGFVHFDDGSRDAFIPAEETLGALSGDVVLVCLNEDEDSRGPSGTVKKILSRGHENFVGCLSFGADGYVIRPLRRELPAVLPVIAEYGQDPAGGAQEGDWVQAKLVPGRHPGSPMSAEVLHSLSPAGSVVGDLNAIVKEYGLPKKYSAVDEQKLADFTPENAPREDLRNLVTVTIDPTDAKDFDDAVSCVDGQEPGQVVIGVHIADVACFVSPDSALDMQARQRGFTSYLPGRTISMLPSVLSTDMCCLREGQDRLAHSVLMTVDMATGEVLSSRRFHSLIRVTRRLTFEEAARAIDGDREGVMLPEPITALLEKLNRTACAMRAWRRENEMFLPLALTEYHVLTGGRPVHVTGVVKNEPSHSSEMIEELMLAANVRVAQELLNRNIPALFRNHAEPDPQGLEDYANLAGAVLDRKRVPNLAERDAMIRFLTKVRHSAGTSGELLCMAFLRCLPRAQYDTECQGHFGLGKTVYCHFTSPIRRYPDLLVHQQLLALDTGKSLREMTFMQEQAAAVNELENNIDQASFAALDRMKLRFLEQCRKERPGECLEAYVLRASSTHLNLFLPEIGLMGIMDATTQRDEGWHYDQRTNALVSRAGQAFRCGSVIYVQIKAIDAIHGDLFLKPAL